MYTLIAHTTSGATVQYDAQTIAQCIKNFEEEYTRAGFAIAIYKNNTLHRRIKKTYR